jgi:short-subunit dehydrogenase
MTADEVAARSLNAIAREKSLCITGWKNYCIAFISAKMPIVAVTRIGAKILRKMRLEQHKK